jgi:hypothetical protein
MTPNEITTLIASNLDRELDVPFRLQLMERIKYWRSRHVANSIGKEPGQRKFFRQTLYVKMTTASASNYAAGIGEMQSISVEKIPLLIRVGTTLFDYVGGVDGKSPFREVGPGTANYLMTGKFASWFPAFEYSNNKLYIDKTGIPVVRTDGIFDDPLLIQQMSCSCLPQAYNCDVWDIEFPCSGDIMQLIVQSILQIDYNRPDSKPTDEVPVEK